MYDWLRSLALLGMAFAAVVVATLGLGAVVIPTEGGEAAVEPGVSPTDGPASSQPAQPAGPVTRLGGTLAISGDREGTLLLERPSADGRYSLIGDDGRIVFEGDPLTVSLVSYDGWEFYLDPGDCELTPGERHDPTGVAGVTVRCEDIDELRDQGTVTIEGTVGVAADLLGMRGGLPESGGTLTLGDETLEFPAAFIDLTLGGTHAGTIFDDDSGAFVTFAYEPQTHELSVAEVAYGGDQVRLDPGACSVGQQDIGVLNPSTRVVELTVRCASIDVPALGAVPLEGTVVAEVIDVAS